MFEYFDVISGSRKTYCLVLSVIFPDKETSSILMII